MTTIIDPEAVPAAPEPATTGGVLPHWKDGAPFAGASDRTAPIYDPATGRGDQAASPWPPGPTRTP